ncbi:creatininase family protein [Hoeflea sp.]|uniref:creatininase family protein n=1 Tax=Hoeflea sp. TaxID=1940281 RepID=UPI003B01B90F
MVFPARNWDDNAKDLEPRDRQGWIAVLPLGAHEQHGPHLPLETDTIIAAGIAEAVSKSMPAELPVTFLPVEPVGYSIEHMDVTGTRTLGWDEAVRRWFGIADMLNRSGVRKFVMLNAHGGNSPLMTIVATEARVRFNMLAVATSWTRFGVPDGLISARERNLGVHAGEIETSVMLALRPDLVDVSMAADFESYQETMETTATHLRAYGPHAFGWKIADLNPDGATGNALSATAKKGQVLIDHAASGLIELLEDVHSFDPDRLR